MQPASFDEEHASAWSRWVLAHGLPALPGADLAVYESVPVAYWIRADTAAVLHIRRTIDDDGDADEEVFTDTDIDLFCRVYGFWEPSGGGGGGWWDVLPLARLELRPNHVALRGMVAGGDGERGCKALFGEVGSDAAFAEVSQAGRTTRRRVEAPTGAFVVCAAAEQPFTVRVLNRRDELLAEVAEPAGFG